MFSEEYELHLKLNESEGGFDCLAVPDPGSGISKASNFTKIRTQL